MLLEIILISIMPCLPLRAHATLCWQRLSESQGAQMTKYRPRLSNAYLRAQFPIPVIELTGNCTNGFFTVQKLFFSPKISSHPLHQCRPAFYFAFAKLVSEGPIKDGNFLESQFEWHSSSTCIGQCRCGESSLSAMNHRMLVEPCGGVSNCASRRWART